MAPSAGASWPRGILRPNLMGSGHSLTRYPVPAALEPYVEWFWAVGWDLPARVVLPAPVLSHPCIHATLEGGSGRRHGHDLPAALVHGVLSRRFEVELDGMGWVVGARFRPGGFAALVGTDAAALTDQVCRWDRDQAEAAAALSAAVAGDDETERVAILADWWVGRAPAEPEATYVAVKGLVDELAADRTLVSVEELARRHHLSVRGVQRLIRWYVGVPPTWLIRRYRLHDALAALQDDPTTDLADLATGLGWYDQAHFTRDFRSAVGSPPAAYLRGLVERVDPSAGAPE